MRAATAVSVPSTHVQATSLSHALLLLYNHCGFIWNAFHVDVIGEGALLDPLRRRRKYAKIKPVVNQVELHPHCQAGTGRDTASLRALCTEQGIVLEACASRLSTIRRCTRAWVHTPVAPVCNTTTAR